MSEEYICRKNTFELVNVPNLKRDSIRRERNGSDPENQDIFSSADIQPNYKFGQFRVKFLFKSGHQVKNFVTVWYLTVEYFAVFLHFEKNCAKIQVYIFFFGISTSNGILYFAKMHP